MMPGLLDFLNTPESALGIGLLAAGSQGKGLGAGLLDATNYAASVRDRQRQNQWDLEDRTLQEKYRNAQIAEMQRKANMSQKAEALLGNIFGGESPGAAPAFGISDLGLSSAPQSSDGTRQGGRLANATADQIALLKQAGIDLTDVWKEARPNYQVQNGYAYDPRTIGQGFIPSVQVSNDGRATVIQPNAGRGGVSVQLPQGAPEAYGTYRGIEAGINAANTPMKVYNPATQREEYVPQSRVLPNPAGSPAGMPPAQPGMRGPGYNGGDRDGANAETLRYIDAEMSRPGLRQEDVAALQREKQRLQAQSGMPQSGNYAAGPSAQEVADAAGAKVRAEGSARADVERDTAGRAEAKLGGKLTAGIDRAIELLGQRPTASLAGMASDKALGAIGMSTKSGDVAEQLATLSGWLVSNVPRMEGPQSNVDVANYQKMAGTVGDSTKPISTRLAAAQEVKLLQQKYAALNGQANSGGASGSWGDEKPPKREFSMLPNAKEYDGKRMKAPDGSIYRSVGGQWKKE